MLKTLFTHLHWYSWCVFMKWKDQFITLTPSSLWRTEPWTPSCHLCSLNQECWTSWWAPTTWGSGKVSLRRSSDWHFQSWNHAEQTAKNPVPGYLTFVEAVFSSFMDLSQRGHGSKANQQSSHNKAIDLIDLFMFISVELFFVWLFWSDRCFCCKDPSIVGSTVLPPVFRRSRPGEILTRNELAPRPWVSGSVWECSIWTTVSMVSMVFLRISPVHIWI